MHIDLSTLRRLLPPGPSGDEKRAKLTPRELESICNSFDECLLSHLRGPSPASVSLAWLSSAVDVLTFAHAAAKPLVPDLELDSGYGQSPWYLDNNLKVLNLCNHISSEIQRLCLHRLKLRIAIEFLRSDRNPSEKKIRQARNVLADLEGEGVDGYWKSTCNIEELIRGLAVSIGTSAPQGMVSPVERVFRCMVHAAGFVTVFVAGVLSAAFHASPGAVARIHVPEEFPWGDSSRTIKSAVIAELEHNQEKDGKTCALQELDDAEACARRLLEAIDEVAASGGSGEMVGRLREMVTGLEMATGVMLEGLERLREAVKGLFQTVMGIREEMMDKLSPETPLKVFFTIQNNKVTVISEI